MSWRKALVVVMLPGLVAYSVLSTYVVSASLQPGRTCSSDGGPPLDLNAEAVTFSSRTDGIALAGWLVSTGRDRAVILIHGIDSDAWAGAAPDLAGAYAGAGFDVLLFDLRAHGRSGGERVGLGSLERGDLRAAVDLLIGRGVPPRRVSLHGTSYGAAMALIAAAEIPEVGAVIADSAFADARDLIAMEVGRRTHVPGTFAGSFLRPGIEGTARVLFGIDLGALAPERVVRRIAPRPLLIIHGERDPVIPPDHARRLAQHAGGNAEVWILDEMGHTEGARSGPCNRVPSPGRQLFLDRVVAFMDVASRSDQP
jgi:pimeloyl-ACP methyl ester carboxylesterase